MYNVSHSYTIASMMLQLVTIISDPASVLPVPTFLLSNAQCTLKHMGGIVLINSVNSSIPGG